MCYLLFVFALLYIQLPEHHGSGTAGGCCRAISTKLFEEHAGQSDGASFPDSQEVPG